jgi:hypothetical protein
MRHHMSVVDLTRGVSSCECSPRGQFRAQIFLEGQRYGLGLTDCAQSEDVR